MVFKSRLDPTDAAGKIEDIARSGSLPYNINQRVRTDNNGHGGLRVTAESMNGAFHDTGVHIHVDSDEYHSGSVISVRGDRNTPEHEVQRVEKELREKYFR